MSPLLSIAQSGLNAAQLRLDASASNIANLPTEDYQRREVVASAAPGGGVQASVRRVDAVGPDLARDIVEQKAASIAYTANLKVIQTGLRTLGSLLDEKA